MTGYSPNGHVLKIANYSIGRIIRLCMHIDKMKSLISDKKMKCKKRLRILKKINKLRQKIRNLKNELHNQTANYLCKNYNVILIPKFGVSNMVIKKHRKITKKSVKGLLNLNHYSFREKLKKKSLDYNNCTVIECNESYTSITCSNCGELNKKLGRKEIFKCKKCKLVIDRDINASRNIFLRSLAKSIRVQ